MIRKQPKDFAYDAWCRNAGRKKLSLLERRRLSEWSLLFEKLMRNRFLMASFRYETFEDKAKASTTYDYAEEGLKRMKRYLVTHNTEDLVDCANYCLLEFEFGRHPDKHFSSEDDGIHAKKKEKTPC